MERVALVHNFSAVRSSCSVSILRCGEIACCSLKISPLLLELPWRRSPCPSNKKPSQDTYCLWLVFRAGLFPHLFTMLTQNSPFSWELNCPRVLIITSVRYHNVFKSRKVMFCSIILSPPRALTFLCASLQVHFIIILSSSFVKFFMPH